MTDSEGTKADLPAGIDTLVLLQVAMREQYLQTMEDLRAYAEKVREWNRRKKAFREYLTALQTFRASVLSAARERGVDLCRSSNDDPAMLAKVFDEHAL